MQFTIDRHMLLKALAHIQSVVERRNTIPILGNVRIEAQKTDTESGAHSGQLKLTATDMELEITENVTAEIGQPGGITVPAHTLYDIVRKLPDESRIKLEAESDEGLVTLSAGRSKFKLGSMKLSDFPTMTGGDMPCRFTISATLFQDMIDRTRFAISTEETRYYLNGIFLHRVPSMDPPVLRAVATDGHRLALVAIPLPIGAEEMPDVILPRKTVNELRKLLDDAPDKIGIEVGESKIKFTIGALSLLSKVIDGTFPQYDRVIPVGNDKIMTLNAKTFSEAVDRVSTIATDKTRAVKLCLQNAQLLLSASGQDAASAQEELEISYQGTEAEIGFNARYLLDVLQQFGTRDVALKFAADRDAPTIIEDQPASENDGEKQDQKAGGLAPAQAESNGKKAGDQQSALYVLMPMRV